MMTEPDGRPRPRRADVADSYDQGVDAYDQLWSPVIRPPAAALIPYLRLTGQCVVADIGAGTGALLGPVRAAAPAARVVALDASAGMLRAVRARPGGLPVLADALALPLADQSADAVILAYVLFHVSEPALALAEAARVLRDGGRAGTVTWAWERGPRAHVVWDDVLARAGVPPAPLRRVDAGLERPDAVEALLQTVGLRPLRIWLEPLRRQWDRASYFKLASGSGVNRIRLGLVNAATRADVLARVQAGLDRLALRDFRWEGEVICAVAAKGDTARERDRP